MERDFDKFYADSYAWILFQAQTESFESVGQLVGATPNAAIHEDGDVRHFRFNALTVDADCEGCETLDEFQDYMLELIRNNPDWAGPNKEAFYSEQYATAWVEAILSLSRLFTEESSEYQLLSHYADIVSNAGFTSNLNPNA